MGERERGRLCPIKADGSEMEPFIIRKKSLYIGRYYNSEWFFKKLLDFYIYVFKYF